jgi:hypothetical protein
MMVSLKELSSATLKLPQQAKTYYFQRCNKVTNLHLGNKVATHRDLKYLTGTLLVLEEV